MGQITKLMSDESGGEVLEYALIAGLIIVGAIALITSVGGKVLARWTSLKVGMDLGEQMLEQIDAAVNVSHRIGAIAAGTGWPLFASRREVQHQDPGLAASTSARMSR